MIADLLAERGSSGSLGAYVAAAAFDRSGRYAALALGDGTVRITTLTEPGEWSSVAAHDGAALCLAAGSSEFVSGGDDGRFVRISPGGEVRELLGGRKWVEQVASAPGGRVEFACAAGRSVHLFDGAGSPVRVLDHPSSVTGLAFDAKGRRIAASHYNGASLWYTGSEAAARLLEWKGSHIGVALHPEMQAVVTAMQENALHGWRLADGEHMRMSGYPAKTESLAFTRNGRYLASSGADAIVLWPFFGGGPMGKPPLELAQLEGNLVTRVAPHPKQDIVAAGYADGTVVLCEIAGARILPVRSGTGSPVSALSWSAEGAHLAIGGADGFAALIDLSPRPGK